MSISIKDVEYVAKLSRLELSDEEKGLFSEQLGGILDYVGQLQELDVDNVEPYISAASGDNVFREDVVKPSLSREEALANAPEQGDDGFIVPKVVEG